MNIEKALKNIGVSGVVVEHCTISEAKGSKFDLFVVSKDLAEAVKSLPHVILLDNILNVKEAETKLKPVFEL